MIGYRWRFGCRTGGGRQVLIGLFSDAHCNYVAVRAAIEAMAPVVDEIICAGDSVYEYRMCNDTVELLREHQVRSIFGNHEAVLLGPQGVRALARPDIRESNVEYLRNLSWSIDVVVGGKRLKVVHGSPFEPYNDYLVEGSPKFKRCAEVDADFLVLGHTHVPMAERAGNVLVINPGSIGESREVSARTQVSYAILDTDAETVEHIRFDNPRLPAAS